MTQSRPGILSGCTLVDGSEFAKAAVLARSFLRFHPEAQFTILVREGTAGDLTIPNVRCLGVKDLGLERGDEWRLPMLLGPGEVEVLLRTTLLEMLARSAKAAVVYFSPATEIFSDLSEVVAAMRNAGGISATSPIRNDWGDHGRSVIGVTPDATGLLRECLARMRSCIDENHERTEDEPQLLEAAFDDLPQNLVHEPGVAVNYSNLDPKALCRGPQGYELNGKPLRSFDFRGYDPRQPHLLSRYLGIEPRILLSEEPTVAQLCEAYRDKLTNVGFEGRGSLHQARRALPSGLTVDSRMLRIYRRELAKHRAGGAGEPPSPYQPEGEHGFVSWLNEPMDHAHAGVTRYMLAVHEDRADVRTAFPNPLNEDAKGFRDWYRLFGCRELALPEAVVPNSCGRIEVASYRPTINVAGYFRAELGIGTAARAIVTALEAADVPVNTVSFDRTASRLQHDFADRMSDPGRADINLICINPDQIAAFAEEIGPEFQTGRYNIGVWFWEVEDFPASMHGAFNYVDEIWVASEFMRETFLKVSPKPVFKFPLPVIVPPIDESTTRSQLGLPEGFLFLFNFDFLSVFERKNPVGLIQAFRRAFERLEGPRLVIKTINGDKRIRETEKLKYAMRDRPDILLIDRYFPAIENATITALADCYISLHRSEGFGFTIAEAMALGKPVIATAYSGNMEFMTPENSYLCVSARSQVGAEREPYPAESYWSDPDLEAAAELLRHVYLHPDDARRRGLRAAEDIRIGHSPQPAGARMAERIATVRRRRATTRPFRSTGFLEDRLEELEARLKRTGEDTSTA